MVYRTACRTTCGNGPAQCIFCGTDVSETPWDTRPEWHTDHLKKMVLVCYHCEKEKIDSVKNLFKVCTKLLEDNKSLKQKVKKLTIKNKVLKKENEYKVWPIVD